jgi:pyruvate dehydrogenase E2 component (dihydrolipoamide acetyltransferase)
MITITMPRLSESMTEGKLLQWNVQVGDVVRAGDIVAEVEADKANMEIEAQEDGVVTGLYGTPGDMIKVGQPVVELSPTITGTSSRRAAPSSTSSSGTKASPLIERLAAQRGIDLAQVKGSGPDGRIEVADLDALDNQQQGASH